MHEPHGLNGWRSLPAGALALVAAFLLAQPVAAQIEEVVVTAQKREQDAQDVGISITVLGAERISESGYTSATDLVAQVPGLTYASPFGDGNNASFTLRGVGLNDFSEHNESPTAVYMDGVYRATLASVNLQLFDVDRVEVLKGPQGTLYGRNTTGGLIHFISRKPTQETDGYAELSVGEYQQRRLEAALGGGLGDAAAARLSLLVHDHDGYRKTRTPDVKDANSTEAWAARLQFSFDPSDALGVHASLHRSEADQVSASYEHSASAFAADGFTEVPLGANQVNPVCEGVAGLTGPGQDCFGYRDNDGDVHETENDAEPLLDLETLGASVTVDLDISDRLKFTSITAYEEVDKLFREDTDAGPVPGIVVTNPVDSEQFSQEMRLAGTGEGHRWNLGLYYFKRQVDTGSRTDVSGIGLVDDLTEDTYETKSLALFGQYEFDLTDRWSATVGGRYTNEEQDFELLARDMLGNTPLFLGLSPTPVPGFVIFDFTKDAVGDLTEHDKDSFSFRLQVDYRPSENVLWFGSIARGIKAPGFNFAIDGTGILGGSTVEQIPFEEETLTAYELGVKAMFHDSALRLNASAYHYDYQDFQAFSFEGITNVVSNKDASVTGLEVEIAAAPTPHLEIGVGLSLLESDVKDIAVSNFFTSAPTVRDRDMVLSPEFEATAYLRYGWPMGEGELYVLGDVRHVGAHFLDINNHPIGKEDAYQVGNIRVGYRAAGNRFELAAWVKNVWDEEYRTYAVPVTSLGFTQNMIGRPQWFGVTFRYNL